MAKTSKLFAFIAAVFFLALLSPSVAKACSCGGWPPCDGTYCWCECNFCSDAWPPFYPCASASLSYDATESDLASFKQQIDAWSENDDLRPVVDVATELYNSVLFKDSQGYLEASDRFRQVINSLSEEARRGLLQSQAKRNRGK